MDWISQNHSPRAGKTLFLPGNNRGKRAAVQQALGLSEPVDFSQAGCVIVTGGDPKTMANPDTRRFLMVELNPAPIAGYLTNDPFLPVFHYQDRVQRRLYERVEAAKIRRTAYAIGEGTAEDQAGWSREVARIGKLVSAILAWEGRPF